MPIRIQRKRTAGFNMQAQSPDGRPVMSVCRPGKWGNPFTLAQFYASHNATTPGQQAQWQPHFNGAARDAFAGYLSEMRQHTPDMWAAYLAPLCDKHLACFCPLDAPCHADVLLMHAAHLDFLSVLEISPACAELGGVAIKNRETLKNCQEIIARIKALRAA